MLNFRSLTTLQTMTHLLPILALLKTRKYLEKERILQNIQQETNRRLVLLQTTPLQRKHLISTRIFLKHLLAHKYKC